MKRIYRLFPECKDYVWGGEKLKTEYGKQTDKTPCAESWELSFHKDGLTKLANGKTLAESVAVADLGENVKKFPFFPVLNKFIDAKENLSVQVHPSDDYALRNENSFGKTEMWYIVSAERGAGIYLGFNREVTKTEFEKAIKENRLTELLNFYEVKAGESYFIPSGTIHAIGKGCLIYEIQQNSNLTYRVYDYARTDKNGKPRELHIEKALKVTNLNKFTPVSFGAGVLGQSEYFTVKKINVAGRYALNTAQSSFACITCVKGTGELAGEKISRGDSFFVPAGYGEYEAIGEMELIETKI
ncbi:MAG: class I mannose-6-phosphate isomerase [Clostridia bacterium]|nr:class I mannose-6-phosphate isomerase [Clostridia bacterium]